MNGSSRVPRGSGFLGSGHTESIAALTVRKPTPCPRRNARCDNTRPGITAYRRVPIDLGLRWHHRPLTAEHFDAIIAYHDGWERTAVVPTPGDGRDAVADTVAAIPTKLSRLHEVRETHHISACVLTSKIPAEATVSRAPITGDVGFLWSTPCHGRGWARFSWPEDEDEQIQGDSALSIAAAGGVKPVVGGGWETARLARPAAPPASAARLAGARHRASGGESPCRLSLGTSSRLRPRTASRR